MSSIEEPFPFGSHIFSRQSHSSELEDPPLLGITQTIPAPIKLKYDYEKLVDEWIPIKLK